VDSQWHPDALLRQDEVDPRRRSGLVGTVVLGHDVLESDGEQTAEQALHVVLGLP
jgi:hypothetical protein